MVRVLLFAIFVGLSSALPTQQIENHLNSKSASSSLWDSLTKELSQWAFTENFGVHVGNASGDVYLYLHGNMTMDNTPLTMASSSKWPSAAMVMGLVADGTIESLDDNPQKYISWWASDPADERSRVTLRQLLSFTSGYEQYPPFSNETLCSLNPHADFYTCVEEQYKHSRLAHPPGTRFSYNSLHLQFAGAIAVAASGLSIVELFNKYLFTPVGMVGSTCTPNNSSNPDLATCLTTTGGDYGRFLSSVLSYRLMPKEFIDQMEIDYTTGDIMDGYAGYGHYCMGHFYECFFNNKGMTEECVRANVHSDPGAYGYYPLIDRSNDYWMQIVVMESGKYYPRSGIPEYLRLAAKPYVDAIMRGEDPITETAREKLTALSLDDVNYIVSSMNSGEVESPGARPPLQPMSRRPSRNNQ